MPTDIDNTLTNNMNTTELCVPIQKDECMQQDEVAKAFNNDKSKSEIIEKVETEIVVEESIKTDRQSRDVHFIMNEIVETDLEETCFHPYIDVPILEDITEIVITDNIGNNVMENGGNVQQEEAGKIIDNENLGVTENEENNEENLAVGIPDTSRKNNKYRRMRGLVYKGLKKDQKGRFNMSVLRCARTLKETCISEKCKNSKNRFCSKFGAQSRNNIFEYFWKKLNWDSRKQYVANLIDIIPTNRCTTQNSTRSVTYVYHLKTAENLKLQVCKKMFLNTLGLRNNMVHDWCKKSEHGMHETDKSFKDRGKAKINRTKEAATAMENFFMELPKLPSHYCRASSTKQYLEPIYEKKSDVYRVYKLYCNTKGISVLSKSRFLKAFEENNLALHRPKKDQCDVCVSHSLGNIPDSDYAQHIANKEAARQKKEEDKKRAKESMGSIAMFTADVQAVMMAPFIKATAIYYKTKLCVHNYTVFNLVTKEVDCYLWNESDGGLEANVFASLLISHLSAYLSKNPATKEIIIYTDNCGYQNKNNILANALFNFAHLNDIEVTHNYLEKGHTQMEVDSAHSLIERKKKNREIYLPTDYINICREARLSQPFHVHYLDFTMFQNYEQLKFFPSIRPGARRGDPTVAQIKSLKYNNHEVLYKINYTDEYSKYKHAPVVGDYTLKPLYKKPIKIAETKYLHLQELKPVLPQTSWNFYDNLNH